MNVTDDRYGQFAIVREMTETVDVIRQFDSRRAARFAPSVDRVLLTGEGSSRIFPAKRTIAEHLRTGHPRFVVTEGATQASEYQLAGYEVYAGSNSGRTAEVVRLIQSCRGRFANLPVTAVVANGDSPIADAADRAYVLNCGTEIAVAATKSVIEQALFYQFALAPRGQTEPDLEALAHGFGEALSRPIPEEITRSAAEAPMIYFAGRNDGVAEELTLKTNEITRKKSDYLEGTYPVHGIEEVMQPGELLVLVDPFPEEEGKIAEVIAEGVGLTVVSIADRETRFPTILVPELPGFGPYLQIAAGWNLLVEIGTAAGVNMDTTKRARKVGNEISD